MFNNRKCEICSSRKASRIILHHRLDDTSRTYVCSECATEQARIYANASIDFEHIVAKCEGKPSAKESSGYSCAMCGTTLADIVVDGHLAAACVIRDSLVKSNKQ